MILTDSLAHAAATDAANRQMKAAGRKVWNENDFNLAAQTKARLMNYCSECCMDAPDHWFTCSKSGSEGQTLGN